MRFEIGNFSRELFLDKKKAKKKKKKKKKAGANEDLVPRRISIPARIRFLAAEKERDSAAC